MKREAKLRDYAGIVGHTTIAMMRYSFLAVEQWCHHDQKTIGGIFFACSEEINNLSLFKSLQRLLAFVFDKVRSSGEFAEHLVIVMIDTIMCAADELIETKQVGEQQQIKTHFQLVKSTRKVEYNNKSREGLIPKQQTEINLGQMLMIFIFTVADLPETFGIIKLEVVS